jgi:hypothetical protein
MEYRVHIHGPAEDGALSTAEFPGVDFSNGTRPILVWHDRGDNVVFKIPAGKCWSGYGESFRSVPGRYLVCRYVGDPVDRGTATESGMRSARVEKLFEMPVSERGRHDF